MSCGHGKQYSTTAEHGTHKHSQLGSSCAGKRTKVPVGGLGGKCGIIALAPGFPPGKVDLVRPRLRRQHLEGVAGMWRVTAPTSTLIFFPLAVWGLVRKGGPCRLELLTRISAL